MKKLATGLVIALGLVIMPVAGAHAHSDQDQQQSEAVELVYDITTEGTVVTFKNEAGEVLPGIKVRVKDEADDPDYTIAEGVTEADGTFDFGPYVEDGVAILRVTDDYNGSNGTILYNVLTGEYTATAGKVKSGDGEDHNHGSSNTVIYLAIAGGIVLIGAIGGVVVM